MFNLLYILADWSVIVGAMIFSKMIGGWIAYLVAVAAIASRQRAFDNLTHEASHGNLFKSYNE